MNKKIIASTLAVIVLCVSMVFYFNYEINKAKEDYNSKISILSSSLEDGLLNLKASINELGENLSMQVGIVDSNLESFKAKSSKEVESLLDLIEQIETQSNIQLNELKDELKNVQIKSQDFTAIVEDVLTSTVSLQTNTGQGSGVVIDDGSYIVTNYHVVNGATGVRISTYSGDVYYARALVGFDDAADIAVLKMNVVLEPLSFGDSDGVKIGEKVIAAGNPAGLSFTVTEGIISAVHRKGPNNLNIYLQTDVSINPGNSGGPLVDVNSRIIGINNFKISGFEGLGFAIESNTVKEVSDNIISQYLQQSAQQ